MKPTSARLLSKLPVIRRYEAELKRLRGELAAARLDIERLRAAQPDPTWLANAQQYEYLWANAFKKKDIRYIEPFGPLAAKIIEDGRTFLNFDRLYTLWQMVKNLPAGCGAVAEVGVYMGGSARFIAEALRLRRREMPFYACDTFRGHAEVDETIDAQHRVGEQFLKVNVAKVRKYLAPFPFVRVLEGNIRDTASELAGGETFGFVHVDVDVYPITRFCLDFFAPRIVAGGALVVDDYGSRTCEGVAKAVDEFAAENANYVSLHLLTGQAVLIRVS